MTVFVKNENLELRRNAALSERLLAPTERHARGMRRSKTHAHTHVHTHTHTPPCMHTLSKVAGTLDFISDTTHSMNISIKDDSR